MADVSQIIERLEEVLSVPFPPTVWPVARQDIRALLDEVKHLQSLLNDRDKFIVEVGLWSDFVCQVGKLRG